MAQFEDEIKRKLNEGEVNFNPDHWAQLNEKLNAQNQYTPFEKKAKDILDGGVAGIPAWDDMNDRLNHASPSEFEKTTKEILNSGNLAYSGAAWEGMRNELSNQDLTAFEKGLKGKLKDQEVPYNPEHWNEMEATLNSGKKRPIGWWSWGGIAAAFLIGAFTFSGLFEKEKENPSVSNAIKSNSNTLPSEVKSREFNSTHEGLKNKDQDTKSPNFIGNEESLQTPTNFFSNSEHNKKPKSVFTPIQQNENPTINDEEAQKKTEEFEAVASLGANSLDLKYAELGIGLGKMNLIPKIITKPTQSQLHAGATLWLNFWSNPAVTGFYGKHQASNCFKINYETIESDNSELGKLQFVQPIQNLAGYERQLGNSGFSIGAYYRYTLKKNWNYNDMNLSASYKKEVAPQLFVRLGASATLKHEQLDVKRLSLREKALYSDYIFTGELGDFRARSEHFISYDLGGFVDHPYFFAGYTAGNVHQTFITKSEEEYMTKHAAIGGVHIPIINTLKASAMLKYEKGLVDTYSPSLGLTFKDKYFAVAEYNKLNRYDLSVGYNWNQRLRVLGSFAIKQLPDYSKELNLDRFEEREGSMSVGIYYTFI